MYPKGRSGRRLWACPPEVPIGRVEWRSHALVVVLGGLAGCGGTAPETASDTMMVDEVVRDLLAGKPSWTTVRARPDRPPAVEALCPAVDPQVDGGDMPALVLAPPGEVRIALAGPPEEYVLRARAGVDLTAFTVLKASRPGASVVLEVLGDGRSLARELVPLDPEHKVGWRDLGGSAGVPVHGGMELVLRTAVVEDGVELSELPLALPAGFGRLRLERRSARARTRSSSAQPNVVLVLVDTLRADRLSAYGYARPTSPALAALAARGVLHEEARSTSSWTWPATASVLTGLQPKEHGLTGDGSSYLGEGLVTLAEMLQAQGFTTAAWSANPIVSPLRNFDQGFERFESSRERFRKGAEFLPEVLAWLRGLGGTRFFLYLHLADPHGPLERGRGAARELAREVPKGAGSRLEHLRQGLHKGEAAGPDRARLDQLFPEAERAQASALYDAGVRAADDCLEALLATLRELGLEEETLVAFTSDHGEELFERGFFGHGQGLHRELVHVPLVLAGPGIPSGRRVAGVLSNRWLAPGLAALAGVEVPGGADARRRLLQGEPERALFSTTKGWWRGERGVTLHGLCDGAWSLQLRSDVQPEDEVALFDLAQDPDELCDVAALHPDKAAELRRALIEERGRQHPRSDAVPAGAATQELLRQLGYAGEGN